MPNTVVTRSANGRVETLSALILPGRPKDTLWDVALKEQGGRHVIDSITQHQHNLRPSCMICPGLVHPHVHLDKAFLLSSKTKTYEDLTPSSGSFPEALKFTAAAKSRYSQEDLIRRGNWLISESLLAGVTAMRAFVEVDQTAGWEPLSAGNALKNTWKDHGMEIQLVAFAQDPIFSEPHGDENRELMTRALNTSVAEVLGTTPYVESDGTKAKENIRWAVEKALEYNLHLDFHLDYNLDPGKDAMVWDVIETLEEYEWVERSEKTIVLGHCTRLTLFSDAELRRLAERLQKSQLPISFVGLPTSDLYMQGRPVEGAQAPGQRPRATLQILSMIKDYKMNGAIGINNVGNAFTPWGSCDPLTVASLCVGIYQTGTPVDAEMLYECVSTRAAKAVGIASASSIQLQVGDPASFVLLGNSDETIINGSITVESRPKHTVQEIVWEPPKIRQIVAGGRWVWATQAPSRV